MTQLISNAVGLPVVIDNDANSVAPAELWFGRPEVSVARDFTMAMVAEGVGTGIIFDGQVYRGQGGAVESLATWLLGLMRQFCVLVATVIVGKRFHPSVRQSNVT